MKYTTLRNKRRTATYAACCHGLKGFTTVKSRFDYVASLWRSLTFQQAIAARRWGDESFPAH